jgi:hypothetical protein
MKTAEKIRIKATMMVNTKGTIIRTKEMKTKAMTATQKAKNSVKNTKAKEMIKQNRIREAIKTREKNK